MQSKKQLSRMRRNCVHQTIDEWVTFKNGTRHIARTCIKCGKLIKYVSQDKNLNTGRFIGLEYDDELEFGKISEGSSQGNPHGIAFRMYE